MKRKTKKKGKNKLIFILISLVLIFAAGAKFEVIDAKSLSEGVFDRASSAVSEIFEEIRNKIGKDQEAVIDLASIPEYSGKPYVTINNNVPNFNTDDLTTDSFESYAPLDYPGRCGVVVANIGKDIMPTEERGSIGMVKPTGWHTVKYDVIEDRYLYNRCHLIGYQLTGENANENNLITGTRYMNVEGMLPFENEVAEYIRKTDHHVLYRVTPIFDGTDLLAKGVLMEAMSVEDMGQGLMFHVFCYNVQPGVVIDYHDGSSQLAERNNTAPAASVSIQKTYICNINTYKFHDPECSVVSDMKEKNKKEYVGSREDLISNGFSPCGSCEP